MTFTQRKLIGVTLIMLGVLLAGFVVIRSTLYAPDTEITPPTSVVATSTTPNTATSTVVTHPITNTPATVVPARFPTRLTISTAKVDAAVQYVGIKSNGAMANPNNFKDVGWYKLGTVPGEIGSAVMAGHVDNALALSGVFKHLGDTKVGDDVYVTRKDGKRLHFKVVDVEYYPYKEAPNVKIFTSTDGKAHLNLVTCAGTWVGSDHSYTERLVIYTTLVE